MQWGFDRFKTLVALIIGAWQVFVERSEREFVVCEADTKRKCNF